MASIANDSGGKKRIQFMLSGKRKAIRLGKVTKKVAANFELNIEALVSAKITGSPIDSELSRWLYQLDDVIYSRLAATGLVKARASALLKPFIDSYIATRTDVKETTKTVYLRARRYLVDYFGADKLLQDISLGDAEKWRLQLLDKGLSENTVRRATGISKQFMASAVRSRLIIENPFSGLVCHVKANRSRYHFITLEDTEKVLESCPDNEWRLMFVLARFGGLRCPSEILKLKWSDINWELDRITVSSSKTEAYEGKESRLIPLFSELKPHLLACFGEAEEGSDYCITRYRSSTVNLRTQLSRIIKKAGLNQWPKLWQNLRSSRTTELTNIFPAHVVSSWLGHSEAVAEKHYLQVTDEHFTKAAQNAAQHGAESSGNEAQSNKADPKEPALNTSKQGNSSPCNSIENQSMGPVGLEPTLPIKGNGF